MKRKQNSARSKNLQALSHVRLNLLRSVKSVLLNSFCIVNLHGVIFTKTGLISRRSSVCLKKKLIPIAIKSHSLEIYLLKSHLLRYLTSNLQFVINLFTNNSLTIFKKNRYLITQTYEIAKRYFFQYLNFLMHTFGCCFSCSV